MIQMPNDILAVCVLRSPKRDCYVIGSIAELGLSSPQHSRWISERQAGRSNVYVSPVLVFSSPSPSPSLL